MIVACLLKVQKQQQQQQLLSNNKYGRVFFLSLKNIQIDTFSSRICVVNINWI
jgi:hypothetical protein